MTRNNIHSYLELVDYINEIGFLPLLNMGIDGWSAEAVCDKDSQYVQLPDGGWEWPLWKWKGPVIRESGCAYGKYICGKAGFISREWWPHFFNYRRTLWQKIEEGSVEEAILHILAANGSMITRDLRKACGFTGPKMRSRFDTYLTHLQMQGYIVTEDFVYPTDRQGREYGWGWSLLTLPENLFGRAECLPDCTPEESYRLMYEHLRKIMPGISDQGIVYFLSNR